MGLVSHAEFELRRAGLYDKDSDYEGMLAKNVVELMRVFAAQGHSEGSAMRTLELFSCLARFKTLTPITSDADEWFQVGPEVWQSKRHPGYFSADGGKTFWCIDPPRGFWAKLRWKLTDERRWKRNVGKLRQAPWQNKTH